MMPNDRRSKRHDVDIDVRLILTEGLSAQANACNISIDGIYLSPSPYPVKLHSLVKINLVIMDYQFHLNTIVVHKNEKGLGLMFSLAEEQLYQFTHNLFPASFDHSAQSECSANF